MTDAERTFRVQTLLNNDPLATEVVLREYLSAAKDDVLEELYSLRGMPENVTDVPAIYQGLQCELAARYFARRGGLGEQAHLENGIHRHYQTSDDRELLDRIIPYARVR